MKIGRQKGRRETGSAMVIIVMAVAAVAIIGVVAYIVTDGFSMSKNPSDDKNTTTNSQPAETGQSGESSDRPETQSRRSSSLPDNFPGDIPIFQPSKLNSATERTSASGDVIIAGFVSDASVEDIMAFYQDKLSSDDWSIDQDSSSERRISASSSDLNIVIDVRRAGDKSMLIITTPGL